MQLVCYFARESGCFSAFSCNKNQKENMPDVTFQMLDKITDFYPTSPKNLKLTCSCCLRNWGNVSFCRATVFAVHRHMGRRRVK